MLEYIYIVRPNLNCDRVCNTLEQCFVVSNSLNKQTCRKGLNSMELK